MRNLTPFLALVFVAGCGSKDSHPANPNLPANQPQCNFVNYHRDEAINVQGAGKCTTDCDCDGMRSCTAGACTGTARPTITAVSQCDDPKYLWNEDWNGAGPGVCANDCECNGTRTCASGHCADAAH
jgi:hypothetical protein